MKTIVMIAALVAATLAAEALTLTSPKEGTTALFS